MFFDSAIHTFFNTLGTMSELDKAIVVKAEKPELECDNLWAKCS